MEIQPEDLRPKLILLVDDDALHLKLVTKALTARGYQVAEAHDGIEAVHIARKEEPDLILLDLGLPHRDGYEVMERLKLTGPTARIPIIVISARPAATAEAASIKSGAIAYLEKPVKINALCTLVSETLHPNKATRTAR